MRKKGRAHPDRVAATAAHNGMKKTLAAVEAAMNASEPQKARELLLSIAEPLAEATGMAVVQYRQAVTGSPDAMFSRDAWIEHRRTVSGNGGRPEPEFGLYDNPKMSWKALFGGKADAVVAHMDALAREATGDALSAIGQRLVKTITPGDRPVARLDLDALEDIVKAARGRFVALNLSDDFAPALGPGVVPQGNADCVERGAMPCVERAMLKKAVTLLRETAEDSHAWVEASVVWTDVRDALERLPMCDSPGQRRDWRVGDAPECQAQTITSIGADGSRIGFERVPVYGPIQYVPGTVRADMMFKWSVMREGGREGHLRLYGQAVLDTNAVVDIVHTIPVKIVRATKEAAA